MTISNTLTKTSFDKHIKENKTLDWDELSYKIICLENELYSIINYISIENKATYEQVIDDCNNEKTLRVRKMFNYSNHLRKQLENTLLSEEEEEDIEF